MAINTLKNGTMEYLVAEGIGVPHCFTTRLGGVSTGTLASLNIGMGRGDDPRNVAENYGILGNAIGFDPEKLVLTHQIHTDVVRIVSQQDHLGFDHHAYPQCDGLITNDPGTALVIFTADCTPILFHDPVTGAVGACHAGWRSTALDIAGKTVKAMVAAFGCDPKNIRAAIGPNVGFCHFETDADVPEALLETYGEEIRPFIHFNRYKNGKYHVDLKAVNAFALRRAGVSHIDISEDCTMCRTDRYWSHRVSGNSRGPQGAIIVCKEETK